MMGNKLHESNAECFNVLVTVKKNKYKKSVGRLSYNVTCVVREGDTWIK